MNLFITGRPGVGKTTLIRSVIAKLGRSCEGFYTREIRNQSTGRVGFEIVTLDGKTALLAHIARRTTHRVGKYFVQIENIDRIIVPCLEAAIARAEVIVIDEIGKMELFSDRFQQVVLAALDAPGHVLGTIALADLPFIQAIKARPDVDIIELSRENYNQVFRDIVARFKPLPSPL